MLYSDDLAGFTGSFFKPVRLVKLQSEASKLFEFTANYLKLKSPSDYAPIMFISYWKDTFFVS